MSAGEADMRARIRANPDLTALAFFALATLLLLWPVIRNASRSLGPNLGDPLLNLYFLEWGAHQIGLGLPDVWSPPFFHPSTHVLTLSDHLLGPALGYLGLREVGLSAPAAYNTLLALSFVLSGWTASCVLRRSGLSPVGALLGGWTFAYSAFRWSNLGFYQVMRMQWIPAVLWTFDRLLERPTPGRALAFLAFYTLHVSGGAYLAYLIHFPLAVLLVNRWVFGGRTFLGGGRLRTWGLTALAALAVLAAFYLPYLEGGVTLAERYPADEVRRHGATLSSFVTPAAGTLDHRLLPFLPRDTRRVAALFPGVAVLTLVGFSIVGRRRRSTADPPRAQARRAAGAGAVGLALVVAGLGLADRFTLTGEDALAHVPLPRPGDARAGYVAPLLLVAVGALIALGAWRSRRRPATDPAAADAWPRGLIASGALMLALCLPALFFVAWSVLPGMKAIRVPSRAFALAAFPLAFLAGRGWDVARRLPGRRGRALLTAAAILLVAEGWPDLPAWQPLPSDPSGFPAYTRWIAEHPEVSAYLELPLGRLPFWEAAPMYLQTRHWRPLVNGYSAVRPPSFREVATLCRPFPNAKGLSRLRQLGVSHVVVHRRFPDWYPGPPIPRRAQPLQAGFAAVLQADGARRVFADVDTEIWALSPAGQTPEDASGARSRPAAPAVGH
jgi:hypothetical protein